MGGGSIPLGGPPKQQRRQAHHGTIFTGPVPMHAPPPPDYQQAAQQQQQGSALNTSGPFGGVSTTIDPATGQPTITSTLSGPLGQAAQNLQHQAAGQGPLPTGDAARQQAINAFMSQAQSRLDPMFQQREGQLEQRLLNQGLDPSSEAYSNAMRSFGQDRNDAYTSALNAAIGQGTEAGSAIFNQGLQSAQMPYSQMAMIQALQNPQFGAAAGMYQSPQALAAAMAQGNYNLTNYGIQQGQVADSWQGIGDVAGALLSFGGGK